MTNIVLLYDRIRWEEKQLHTKAEERGINLELVDARELLLTLPDSDGIPSDIVLQRCVSHSKGTHVAEYFESHGSLVINSSLSGRLCGDKLSTSLTLAKAGIPHPKTYVAFSKERALNAAENLGYPVISKPLNGSWGREIALLSDARSLKSYLELKENSSDPEDHIFYLQEFVENPGRDIRSVCVGDQIVASIYRNAPLDDWRSNVALGGEAKPCQLHEEEQELVLKSADAVGGEIVGVDAMESPRGFLIHEVNSNVEFRGATSGSGVDVAGRILDYLTERASK